MGFAPTLQAHVSWDKTVPIKPTGHVLLYWKDHLLLTVRWESIEENGHLCHNITYGMTELRKAPQWCFTAVKSSRSKDKKSGCES